MKKPGRKSKLLQLTFHLCFNFCGLAFVGLDLCLLLGLESRRWAEPEYGGLREFSIFISPTQKPASSF